LYKRAVYCYLCKHSGDDESINDILDNVDDFLWFKLNVIQLSRDTSIPAAASLSMLGGGESSAPLTFHEFQTKLSVDWGEKYFIKNNRNPFTYLHVLLLTAQFELAVELLLKYESTVVHGVHMAITLFEKRLLNVVKSPSNSQLIIPAGLNDPSESVLPKCFRRINFACLLKMYTRKFEHADCREALEYYFFLRNLHTVQNAQQQQQQNGRSRIKNYFAQYITELALETREFELLFGRLEKVSVVSRGVCDLSCQL
jgi:nuclear pore complex protein Nup93